TFDVKVSGKAKPKDPKAYRVVGQPVARFDIPLKISGSYRYIADLRVPGMLHGRVIRPPEAGAKLVRVDLEAKLPGLAKVVRHGECLGVVCEREEQAIAAARSLRVEWSRPEPVYWSDYDGLYEHLRAATPKVSKDDKGMGEVGIALGSAARMIEARYEYPFQSHASMGPAC